MINTRVLSDNALATSISCCSATRHCRTSRRGLIFRPTRSSSALASAFVSPRFTMTVPRSRPSQMLSATDMSGTRLSSWRMVLIPSRWASLGLWMDTGCPSMRMLPW
jgi:hypothetical protein